MIKPVFRTALILLFWLGVWSIASYRFGKPLLFPAPLTVIKRLWELLLTKEFYLITANSLFNILYGILVAVLCGCVLSVITSKFRLLRAAILPIMNVIKATPVASFILLTLILLGAESVPSFITALIVIPLVWTNLDEGFAQIDPLLIEVSRVYAFSPWKRLTSLTFPSLKPYFLSAMRASIGLAWKAGVAAEILAMPLNSIGTEIYEARMYLEVVDMFAWTLLVILLSVLLELLFSLLFQKSKFSKEREEIA